MLEQQYKKRIAELIERIVDTQRAKVEIGAKKIAASLIKGEILHVFGSGHSAMIAQEITGRAGGLVPVNTVPDPTRGMAERVEGYGKVLLSHYAEKYMMNPGEVMIIISTSGRNPVPIDIAIEAKHRGLYTIGITSVEYSQYSTSRHSSGKRLFEVVDLTLDNCVPAGDAVVEIKGLAQKVGPSSTFTGAFLANMLILQTIEELLRQGTTPPILISSNQDGADKWNQALWRKYRNRLVR